LAILIHTFYNIDPQIQIRGDFISEEERIANLFKTKSRGKTK
jgi:hypothetical protein